MKRNIYKLLIIVLLIGMMGLHVTSAQAASCTQYHTVKKGESLAKIAPKYGTTWQHLAVINGIKSPYKIYTGQKICVSTSGTVQPPKPGVIPTFSIVGVVRDQNVTIQTHNFPANDNFRVLMGHYSTKGVNGIQVTTWNSGSGGTQSPKFNIPSGLAGSYRIAIRLESTTGSGYYAYNWFYNNTTGTSGGTSGTGGKPSGYTGFPTFSIHSVVRNQTVTILTKNFPPGLKFDVLMGPMGTRGVNGIHVGTINSGAGGSFTATFNIPSALMGSHQIAIRAQNYQTGYYAYNWFYNNNTH